MAFFKVIFDQQAWLKEIRDKQRPVAKAAVEALDEVADEAVKEGRDNIAAAGRFGPKWQQGLQYRLFPRRGDEPSLQSRAVIFHTRGLAGVFEFGAEIQGKPMLWIPTTPGAPPPRRSGKQLVSATVRGKPMLFDARDRDRHRKPLYIGVSSIRIEKKWRIIEIVKEHADRLGESFLKHFKDE